MISMLIAYNAAGEVVATLDFAVQRDALGNVLGLIDFEAYEESGGEMLNVWNVSHAVGSKTWPEWVGSAAHDFTVELVGLPGDKRLAALVHKQSGFRRERDRIKAAIADRVVEANNQVIMGGPPSADISDLVGGPDRPMELDDNGRTLLREVQQDGSVIVKRVDSLGRKFPIQTIPPPPVMLPLVGENPLGIEATKPPAPDRDKAPGGGVK